ncbi:hypothetical protein [Nocardia brasiliensis]|nr:hypothetical protein [Nocardia brasiliensis]SUB41329.1 Uncharacterised protein [Nocardia brasiliensis]
MRRSGKEKTGRFVYLRHVDGATVEYVQWSTELRGRLLGNRTVEN